MGKQYFGTSINNSSTICAASAADVDDIRCKVVAFDDTGKIVVASTAGETVVGLVIPTAGDAEGKIVSGDMVDVQIKDIGVAIAGGVIDAGAAVCADASGNIIAATEDGQFILGYALNAAAKDDYVEIQIAKGFFAKAATD